MIVCVFFFATWKYTNYLTKLHHHHFAVCTENFVQAALITTEYYEHVLLAAELPPASRERALCDACVVATRPDQSPSRSPPILAGPDRAGWRCYAMANDFDQLGFGSHAHILYLMNIERNTYANNISVCVCF